MTQTITALFDTVEQAERAANDLAMRVGGVRGTIYRSSTVGDIDTLSVPEEDRAVLRENIRRGGAVFYAEVSEGKFQAVADALEAAGAVDFDEREAAWRSEGWTGASGATGAGTPVVTGDDTTVAATTTEAGSGASVPAGSGAATTGATGGEERIPIVEERLRVGKREVEHDRVRVRSYVVETPVQEQVMLHQERVEVERRPVDRPVAAGDDAFRERTIEATEISEEAVVSKEARVREEVVIRKEAEERTETVQDTVRRTEVEVEDERGRTGPTERRDRV